MWRYKSQIHWPESDKFPAQFLCHSFLVGFFCGRQALPGIIFFLYLPLIKVSLETGACLSQETLPQAFGRSMPQAGTQLQERCRGAKAGWGWIWAQIDQAQTIQGLVHQGSDICSSAIVTHYVSMISLNSILQMEPRDQMKHSR